MLTLATQLPLNLHFFSILQLWRTWKALEDSDFYSGLQDFLPNILLKDFVDNIKLVCFYRETIWNKEQYNRKHSRRRRGNIGDGYTTENRFKIRYSPLSLRIIKTRRFSFTLTNCMTINRSPVLVDGTITIHNSTNVYHNIPKLRIFPFPWPHWLLHLFECLRKISLFCFTEPSKLHPLVERSL